MAKVGVTTAAVNFVARHAVAEVLLGADVLVRDRLKEARPARSRVKLGIRAKERETASYARIDTCLVVVVENPAEGAFCALCSSHFVLLRCELCPPLLVGLHDSLYACRISKGSVILQEADVDFFGLIFHDFVRFGSASYAGGQDNNKSNPHRKEDERKDMDGFHGRSRVLSP